MQNRTSIYDTFNAKYLSYHEIAESFVPNEEYYQLLQNNHTLLMGPRGCGKTTLLKMLTPSALNMLKEPLSHIKSIVPFTAIYIPSDIQWKSQLNFLNKHLESEKELNERIVNFLITTNVQIALCRTIYSLLRYGNFSKSQFLELEDDICRGLINIWDIEKPLTASLDEIELNLQKRVFSINTLVSKFIFQKNISNISQSLPTYVFNDFFDVIKVGCVVVENKLSLKENHRWALCFDELEISPKFLQIKLFNFLRSVDQKYLFKLTTTPLVNLDNNLVEASQDNDFKAIKLWVYDDSGSKKWRDFCNNLISDKIRRRYGNPNLTPEDFFGNYNLDDIIKEELHFKGEFEQGTVKGSSVYYLFKTLAEEDVSFRSFLINRNLNPKEPFSKNLYEDKSIFLKHKVNVIYRFLFRARTRKSPAIHYGIPYIYDLCDGNPRSLIGLIDEILSRSEINFQKNSFQVPPNRQSEIIFEASKKYFNLIRNHPDSTLTIRNNEFNLANDILKEIGNYIYQKIVKEDFNPSIPTTFTVDNEIDHKVIRLLEHALYLGVIVYLDPIESLSNNGLIGKRFRMSYLLTPLFRIPNRVNSQINIKNILTDSGTDSEQTMFDFN